MNRRELLKSFGALVAAPVVVAWSKLMPEKPDEYVTLGMRVPEKMGLSYYINEVRIKPEELSDSAEIIRQRCAKSFEQLADDMENTVWQGLHA